MSQNRAGPGLGEGWPAGDLRSGLPWSGTGTPSLRGGGGLSSQDRLRGQRWGWKRLRLGRGRSSWWSQSWAAPGRRGGPAPCIRSVPARLEPGLRRGTEGRGRRWVAGTGLFSSSCTSRVLPQTKLHPVPALCAGLAEKQRASPFVFSVVSFDSSHGDLYMSWVRMTVLAGAFLACIHLFKLDD